MELRLDELRAAVRGNEVSFPSQVPVFEKHDRSDLQPKLVQLFFTFGWSAGKIATRYGILRQRVQQILTTWKRRAIEMGYIQHIPPADKSGIFAIRPIQVILSPIKSAPRVQLSSSTSASSQSPVQVSIVDHSKIQKKAELRHMPVSKTTVRVARQSDGSNRPISALCSLQDENTQLRALVAELRMDNARLMLMTFITKTDRPQA